MTVGAAVLILAVSVPLSIATYLARQREMMEADTRAKVEVWASLDLARQRLQFPTQDRQTEAQAILHKLVEPRRNIVSDKETERMDIEARSLYAWTLGVLELQVQQYGANLGKYPYGLFSWPVAIHPDGDAMAVGTCSKARPIVYWQRGSPLKMPPEIDFIKPPPRLSYSPDGRHLARAPFEGGLQIWDKEATRSREILEKEKGAVLGIGWGTESLWACGTDGCVRTWSLPDFKGGIDRRFHGKPGTISTARFNTGATLLAVATDGPRIFLYDRDGNGHPDWPAEGVKTDGLEVKALAFSPDNKLLAAGDKDGDLHLFHRDGRIAYLIPAFSSELDSIEFSSDGRWVLAGQKQGSMTMFDVETGRQVLTGGGRPSAFARDGRRFAQSDSDRVAFCELQLPHALIHHSGHRAHVQRFAWSGDSRRLVTMDSRFEIRVWDVDKPRAILTFRPLAGSFYCENAAVALSTDGKLLAYASGGESEAFARIYEVATGTELCSWKLPGGFESLASVGDNKFVLVREEFVPGMQTVQSVVYELTAGKPLGQPRIIRRSKEGDQRRFLSVSLTPDGKYYCWAGPRKPETDRRVEVIEVATGQATVIRRPHPKPPTELGAHLSRDGRYLWISDWPEFLLVDLFRPEPAQRLTEPVVRTLRPDNFWLICRDTSSAPDARYVPWSSPDGRYLSWGNTDGTVSVANLPALRKVVAAYEKLLPK